MDVADVHRQPGKLGALAWLLSHRSSQVEADLAQFYGVLDMGSLSVRKLWVLVSQLPREARVIQAEVPAAVWSSTDYLLARVVDELAVGNWLYQTVHSKKPPPQPKPLQRPGVEEEKEPEPTGAYALAQMLGQGGGAGG